MSRIRFPLLALAAALVLGACGEPRSLLPPDGILPDGGHYRGPLVNGLLEGRGRIDYPDGSWFEGQFVKGMREGEGEARSANGTHYLGHYHLGQFDGEGSLTYPDGSRYQGQFRAGRMHGHGKFTQGELVYEGEFKDDKYYGHGKLTWPNGYAYEGEFANGEPEGQGDGVDADGNHYIGHYQKGRLTGEGHYTTPDGDRYTGEFKDQQFDGKGRYENQDGEIWVGTFKNGGLVEGDYQAKDGTRYRGGFQYWSYQGQGHLSNPDGSVYEGGFDDDLYDGEGTLTLADGSKQAGTWARGTRIADETGAALPDSLEQGLLTQGQLLTSALAAVPASTAAPELYTISVAGDGSQGVFLREADYAATLLRQRFHAYGQISLINHRDHLADRPMATRENLRQAIATVAERSGPEDLVFLFMTSHGSADHQFSLNQPRLNLNDLPAKELARLLAPLKNRDKVVVISACFSGGFLPELKDEHTLVMTAASADRKSFGCSDDSDFTYFGRALFAEALNETGDLKLAFERARERIAEREKKQRFTPSQPQIWAPEAVLAHWRRAARPPSGTIPTSLAPLSKRD